MSDLPMAPIKGYSSLANSVTKETKNMGAKTINSDIIGDTGLNSLGKKFKKEISSIMDSGVVLKYYQIKGIMKVIKSLVNREISLKVTSRKATVQEVVFLNFLGLLMTASLPFMNSVFTLLA